WIDARGRAVATFRTDALQGEGPTAELEILRGDLARLLYDATRDAVRYRFGDCIAAVQDDGTAATVRFESGRVERFDAVVVAEGVGSSTREQVFAGQNRARWMDLTIAYFTLPRTADDDRMWRWYHAPGGRSISLRPDRHGTTRAMLSLQGPSRGEQDWDVQRQKAYLRQRFADAGWQAPRVLAGLADTDDFYLDVLRQVRLPRWHQGRTVLT
ncbi:FAD-binding monooxygenase, partial [Xanthomonas sp. Kuri4-3]